jgi:hypothetical protein
MELRNIHEKLTEPLDSVRLIERYLDNFGSVGISPRDMFLLAFDLYNDTLVVRAFNIVTTPFALFLTDSACSCERRSKTETWPFICGNVPSNPLSM